MLRTSARQCNCSPDGFDSRKARPEVTGIRRLQVIVAGLLLISSSGLSSTARGQAVAYDPQIGLIPSGATMTVTPVVSPDRRYVRLGVNVFFNELNSLQTFSFPGGAVSGGGGAFGGFGGMNGVIGGGGGAVGGGGAAVGGGGVAMGSAHSASGTWAMRQVPPRSMPK